MGEKTLERWLLFTRGTMVLNIVLAIGKLAVGLYSASVFLAVNALYSAGLALAKFVALKGYRTGRKPPDETHPFGYGREEYKANFRVGLILAISAVIYMIYCSRMFIIGSNIYYSEILAIAIAAITFTEIGVAIRGIVIARKSLEPVISATKMMSLASALISLVLTQTALLSFSSEGDQSFPNGLVGLIFGGAAAGIGIYMMVRMAGILGHRHYDKLGKQLKRISKKYKVDIGFEPVQLYDHGARARFLQVRLHSGKETLEHQELLEEHLGVTLLTQELTPEHCSAARVGTKIEQGD